MLNAVFTGPFKKDHKLMKKQNKDMDKLNEVMDLLINEKSTNEISFNRTGSHSELY